MRAWLKRFFHFHEWETYNEEKWERKYSGGTKVQYRKVYQRCKVCGHVRQVEL